MFQNIFGWNLHGGLFFKTFRLEFENTENRKISSALILFYMRVISEGIAFQSLSVSCCRTYWWQNYFVTGCKTWALLTHYSLGSYLVKVLKFVFYLVAKFTGQRKRLT